MKFNKRPVIFILIIIAVISISISPIISNSLIGVSYTVKSFWRMAIASIIMWVISLGSKGSAISGIQNLKVFVAGTVLGLHFIFFYGSIDILRDIGGVNQISNATVLGTLAPIFILFYNKIFLKKKITGLIFFSLALALFGSILIFYNDISLSSDLAVGNLYAVVCSMLLSITFIISTDIRKIVDTIQLSKFLYLYAAIACFIVAVITNENLMLLDRDQILMLVLLGVVPTILGHNIFYYLIGSLSPVAVSSIPLAEPLVSTMLSIIFFGLIIPAKLTIIGGCVTLLGLVILLNNQVQND